MVDQGELWLEALRTLSPEITEPSPILKKLIGRITLCDGAFTRGRIRRIVVCAIDQSRRAMEFKLDCN